MKTVWHYTVGARLDSILGEGVLRTTSALIGKHEKPAVWFTRSPNWEQTANKGWLRGGILVPLNQDDTRRLCRGLYRFGVDPAVTDLLSWEEFKSRSRIDPLTANNLEAAAIRGGSKPGDYLTSLRPVPRSEWVSLEVYYRGEWQAVDIDQLSAA